MKQLNFKLFTEQLGAKGPGNLIVIYGEERFFFDSLIHKIEDAVFRDAAEKDLNYHMFYGEEADLSQIISTCLAYPMLAEKKMVVVKDFDRLMVADKESVLKYIENPQGSTVLVMVAGQWRRGSFYDAILKKSTVVRCRNLSDQDIYEWAYDRLQKAGLKPGRESVAFLIENIGNNLLRLDLEIQKIVNYCPPGEKLTAELISGLIGFSREVNIFNLQKSLAGRDLQKSIRIALSLLEQGEQLVAILPMLFNFFRRLWVVKYLRAKKQSRQQILDSMHGNPFAYSDIFNTYDNFSFSHLRFIFERMLESEIHLKTSQKSQISILIMLCFYICHNKKKQNN